MENISKKSLAILVLIAMVSSIAASTATIVAIDKTGAIQNLYQSAATDATGLPAGIVKLYVEPKPTVKSGEVKLEVK